MASLKVIGEIQCDNYRVVAEDNTYFKYLIFHNNLKSADYMKLSPKCKVFVASEQTFNNRVIDAGYVYLKDLVITEDDISTRLDLDTVIYCPFVDHDYVVSLRTLYEWKTA